MASSTVERLLIALDAGPEAWDAAWEDLQPSAADLAELLVVLSLDITMRERCELLEAATDRVMGHGFWRPH